jgi:ABC-type multidrug transport system fused ATPase/permease subunit
MTPSKRAFFEAKLAHHLGVLRVLTHGVDKSAWAWFALAIALVTGGGLVAGFAPLTLKRLVDHLSEPMSLRQTWDAPYLISAYVGALVLQRLFEQIQAYAYGVGEQRLVRRLTGRGLNHMLRLPLGYHVNTKSGALAQALSNGVMGWRLICTPLVLTVTPVVVQLVVALIVLNAVVGSAAGLVLLAALTAYTTVFSWGVIRLHGPVREVSAAQVEMGGAVADALMNVEALKAFTAEGRFARRHDEALAVTERLWRRFLFRRAENGVLAGGVFGIMMGVTVFLAAGGVATGRLSLGAFVLVNTYVLQLVRPLELMGFAVRDMGQGLAYLAKLLSILEEPMEATTPVSNDIPPPLNTGPADLAFHHVDFAFGPARQTLRNISFHAAPGSTVAVVGPSGAGKSSLVRLVLRFYEPDQGDIRLDGRPIADWPLDDLRRQIALVSQDTILLNDTIAENIGLAMDNVKPDAVLRAAAAAHLTGLLDALPDGVETLVGERGLKLSGGEKQRVAIARAALKEARLIIFDEATAALDPATERAVWAAMRGLAKTVTALVVTHRLATIADADQILVLDQGVIVERGDHQDLIADRGLYWRLWRAQHSTADEPDDVARAASF